VTAEHPLYSFLLAHAGHSDPERALVQAAVLHRPRRDDLEVWVCQRCSWCQAIDPLSASPDMLGSERHLPVSAYAPCEELRLLAWPYRDRPGYEPAWAPEEVEPTNPPTLLGGRDDE
jgi:hypothetical protein